MISLSLVAAARPNFMKIAPLIRAIVERSSKVSCRLIHTGQHYDREMNGVFFDELGIPEPDIWLGCGGGSHARQTAKIMVAFEQDLLANRPDWVVVVGDVNSTLACSIVARKLGVRVAHVEAGLRSGDRSMPEEINRLVTDSISDLFFVTERAGLEHLRREGKPESEVHYVGNVMIDNLFYQMDRLIHADTSTFPSASLKARLQESGRYAVATLHRPSNVDDEVALRRSASAIVAVAEHLPTVFPVHPRTRAKLDQYQIDLGARVHLSGPLSYMEFLNLWKDAALVITDSGGLQEETTGLGVPCVTMRENTERPVTVEEGTNVIAGTDPAAVVTAVRSILDGHGKVGRRPRLWDGRASTRIVDVLVSAAEGEA